MAGNAPLIAAGVGAATGAAVWLALVACGRRSPLSFPSIVAVLISAGIACRLAYALGTPIFYAPDEQAHFTYIKYVAHYRALPIQTSRTEARTGDWEYYQPPLYYVLMAPLYGAARFVADDQAFAMVAIRLMSIPLWLLNVALTLLLLRYLGIQDLFVRTFVVGIVCLLPTWTFVSSVVNSDNLVLAMGAGILCLLAREKGSDGLALATGVLLGAALVTKLSAGVYLSLAAVLALLALLRGVPDRKTALIRGALTLGPAVLIWAPWLWRNWRIYGSLTAESVANVPARWPSAAAGTIETLRYMQSSFWAVSGIINDVSGWFPLPGIAIGWVAAAGIAHALFRRPQTVRRLVSGRRDLVAAALAAIAVNFGLVMRFGLLYGQGQGRYLYPVLVPLALLLAAGLRSIPASSRPSAPAHVAGAYVAYAFAFTAFSLAVFPRP